MKLLKIVNLKYALLVELSNQVHLIKDMILSDMVYVPENEKTEEILAFSKHLYCTKIWFVRISCANKKRFLLALLDDVRSAYTLSLLLQAMWNCKPKDAIMSANEFNTWSSFDQVPMDHNRTAQPLTLLTHVMKNDRKWFLTLDSEAQAMVLSELLTVSGGPIMWEILKRSQRIYEHNREQQLQHIVDCIVVTDHGQKEAKGDENKKDQKQRSAEGLNEQQKNSPGLLRAQKVLETVLANWNSALKSVKDSLKLEEIEISFKDGTKRKMWKVNRPRPEVTETVDFMQLLPASLSKRILSYIPRTQLGDYAKVNKYWAYLVEDLRAEINVRQKIDNDLEKLKSVLLERDTSLDQIIRKEYKIEGLYSNATSIAPSMKLRQAQASVKMSEKSTHYSFRHFLSDQMKPQPRVVQKPITNMKELTERLERRGAADDNLFHWCENVLKIVPKPDDVQDRHYEGILHLSNIHFPCPLMAKNIKIPLQSPLCKDPALINTLKPTINISNASLTTLPRVRGNRYSLWSKDFSKLYRVYKIPSHSSPI